MAKISHAGFFSGLSAAILVQFTFEMCIAAKNRENLTKTHYFEDSRSFKVIDVGIPKKLVANSSYNKQHVCAYLFYNHFHARQANSDKIQIAAMSLTKKRIGYSD